MCEGFDLGKRNPLLRGLQEVDRRLAALMQEARALFYEVMLFLKPCPACGLADLSMVGDSEATCTGCGHSCDPTLVFQTCPDCDSALVRRMYHYFCPACRIPVRSHYCFDVKVFDADYFRERMAVSRTRKRERIERIRTALLNSRSPVFMPDDEPPVVVPIGIATALADVLVQPVPEVHEHPTGPRFDLSEYRSHLLDLVTGCVVQFDGVSPLITDRRVDRAFRFVAAVFMENEGLLQIRDDGAGHLQLVGA